MAHRDQEHSADDVVAFEAAMRAAGLDPAKSIIPDGKLHRLRWRNERKGPPDGFYVLHLDSPRPAGAFGCWKRGVKETWTARGGPMNAEVRRQLLAKVDADRTRRELEERRRHKRVAEEAGRRLAKLPASTARPCLLSAQGRRPAWHQGQCGGPTGGSGLRRDG